MTLEEAIERIKTSCYLVGYPTHDEEYKNRKAINEALDMAINSLENEGKLLKENKALKNRCKVSTQGLLCAFCPLECEQRAEEFTRGGGRMTREDAINYLENSMAIGKDDASRYHNEVLELTIKALEQEPKTDSDCISRAEAIRLAEQGQVQGFEWQLQKLITLSSVTPTLKTGHWDKGYTFPDGEYWKCTKCKELIKVKYPMKYCNNCGAKMESEG